MTPPRILILCSHNSARSQMAEGWLRKLCANLAVPAEICSGGQGNILGRSEAQQVMSEVGLQLPPCGFNLAETREGNGRKFDAVITVVDSIRAVCPAFAGSSRHYRVDSPDPSGDTLQHWRKSRDQLGRVMTVLAQSLAD